MAKRRILKKEIGYTFGYLFIEAMFCKLYLPETNPKAADSIMTRILDMQDNFICRAGKPDGKDNTKLVKTYYKKLREDLQKEINAIAAEIGELTNKHEANYL